MAHPDMHDVAKSIYAALVVEYARTGTAAPGNMRDAAKTAFQAANIYFHAQAEFDSGKLLP